MPINTSAVPPEPDEPQPDVAPEAPSEEPKRGRRTKKEMIADAVVPADDALVEIKDSGTGAKIERPWPEAVVLVKDGKADWVDKAMKYALLKYEEQAERPADEDQAPQEPTSEPDLGLDSGKRTAADLKDAGAQVGDEVVIGAEIYIVGHGHVLVQGMVAIDGEIVKPQRRWQRELGAGPNGAWESREVVHPHSLSAPTPSNGHKDTPVAIERQSIDPTFEQTSPTEWRIGTGELMKIGLPDYSSLQVGPITASRNVIDDGRRTEVEIRGRKAIVPTACVEAFREAADLVDYVGSYQRGELVSFLESTGSLQSAP